MRRTGTLSAHMNPSNTRGSGRSCLATASQWLSAAEAASPRLQASLRGIYGPGTDVPARRLVRIRDLAARFLSLFGDGPVIVTRAPGRVNLMGRHIDHQGGHCNMLAIEHDLYIMAGLRGDAQLRLHNLDDSAFPPYVGDVHAVLPGYVGGDWRAYVDSTPVCQQAAREAGQWQQYVKAAIARLIATFPETPWQGLNIVAAGDIPIAAGLSSSSALVVAAAEAIAGLYGLSIAPERFAEMCGEAEWYVGARGGAGDQAAMKFAQTGHVVQLSFHPLRVEQVAPWPEECSLLVFNSGILARKSAGARNTFNQRVACYHIAREIVKLRRPDLAERIGHLRDLAPFRMAVPDARIAELMLTVPERMTRTEITTLLGDERAAALLASHTWDDGHYYLRSVAMFGITECERSRRCSRLLEDGATQEIGRLMTVSHDGDRVSCSARGNYGPNGKAYPDSEICDIVDRCRAGASLADEPGAYACSTPEIDHMVDTSLRVAGVLGSQLSGAGLGGCMMVLAQHESVPAVIEAMEREHYTPRELPVMAHICRPVGGSGTIALA
ncbi:MAG: hypothetical protein GX446_06535 [Chthonomonadales bacterium]|nr:hypothetical protein [Chthonomonadales bacterium]